MYRAATEKRIWGKTSVRRRDSMYHSGECDVIEKVLPKNYEAEKSQLLAMTIRFPKQNQPFEKYAAQLRSFWEKMYLPP